MKGRSFVAAAFPLERDFVLQGGERVVWVVASRV